MLALLSGLEAQSEHPIAAAIRRRAEAEGLPRRHPGCRDPSQ